MMTTMQDQQIIYDYIRHAIEASDKTRYRLSKETGISEGHLCQFMGKTKGLSVEAVELLASHLNLEIIIRPAKRTKTTSNTSTKSKRK